MAHFYKELTIYTGYRIIQKETVMSIPEAISRLCARGKHRYVYVRRDTKQAILTTAKIRCPYCGKDTPICSSNLRGKCVWPRPIFKSAIRRYLTQHRSNKDNWESMSFIEPRPIIEPFSFSESFSCTKCLRTSQQSDKSVHLTIESNDSVISMRREIADLSECLSVSWAHTLHNPQFPLTESLCFDFCTRAVYMRLTDKNGVPLCTRCIFEFTSQEWRDSPIDYIKKYKTVRRTLRQAFTLFSGGHFPFACSFPRIEHFMIMTEFPSASKEFYLRKLHDRVRYGEYWYHMDCDFSKGSGQIRNMIDHELLSLGMGIARKKDGVTLVDLNTEELLLDEKFDNIILLWGQESEMPLITLLSKDGKWGAAVVYSNKIVEWRIPCQYNFYKEAYMSYILYNETDAVYLCVLTEGPETITMNDFYRISDRFLYFEDDTTGNILDMLCEAIIFSEKKLLKMPDWRIVYCDDEHDKDFFFWDDQYGEYMIPHLGRLRPKNLSEEFDNFPEIY